MQRKLLLPFALVAALTFMGTARVAHAQEASVGTEVISVNVLDAIDGFFNLGWEHVLSTNWSFTLGAEVLAFRGVFDDYPGSLVGIGPTAALNLYLLGDAPQGLWLGPMVVGSWLSASNGGESNTSFGYALGGRIGVSVVINSIYLALGIGVLWRSYSVNVSDADLGPQGFRPRFELSLGFAF